MTLIRMLVLGSAAAAVAIAAGVAGRMGDTNADGLLPKEASVLPPDSGFVMGLDVQKFVASPLYTRFGSAEGLRGAQGFMAAFRRAGLDAEKDLDRVIVAGGATGSDSTAL